MFGCFQLLSINCFGQSKIFFRVGIVTRTREFEIPKSRLNHHFSIGFFPLLKGGSKPSLLSERELPLYAYVWHRMATNYGAVVVTPSYVLQPSRVDVIIAAPPYQGDSFVESYGGNLFSCTDDVQSCCFAWLCMPGATGNIAGFGAGKNEEDNGCSCLQHCCGMFLCPFFWSCWGVSARGLLEERLALEHLQQPLGDMCSDFFRQACCGCCATAQSLRAIKNFKRQNGTSSNSYVKHAGGVESVEMER